MSNNDEMDIEKDRGRGLRAPNKTTEGHGVRGQTGSSHGTSETGNRNTDEDHEQWNEVGGRTKGGTQKANYKQDNSNIVGTRSGGAYYSSENRSIFGDSNGNRLGQDAERGVDPNTTTNTTTADGMEHYSVNVGYVDMKFMCGNGKGFNVARGIKQFIAAARAIDKDFCLLPLGGQDNNLCIPADVPNSKEGIQKYFRHRVSVNNVAGSIKIQTKFSISKLKHP
jgi:hypothetical protein